MDDNRDKTCLTGEENKKDNNPLSVRVDPYYKEVFEDLIKQKGIPKKTLLEAMISSYVDSGNEDKRESNISFANEINLIAGNFNEILGIFKTIATKSQDTIGSLKNFYEQKIRNLEINNQVIGNDIATLKEENKLFETMTNDTKIENDRLEKVIRDLNQSNASYQKEITIASRKYAELLEEINILRKMEKENVLLKLALDDKKYENEKLIKRISDTEESVTELKNKKSDEFKQLEMTLKKEMNVDKKMEILKLQLLYNELQTENLKNLGIINKKSAEIAELKRK